MGSTTNERTSSISQIARGQKNLLRTTWLGLTLVIAVSVAKASAIQLQPTRAGVEIALGGLLDVCGENGVSFASCSVGGSVVNANVTNGRGGSVSASSQIIAQWGQAAAASADVMYDFAIEGPRAVNVPVIFSGYTDVTSTDHVWYSYAAVAVYPYDPLRPGSDPPIARYVAAADPSDCAVQYAPISPCGPVGSFTINALASSNTEYVVILEAEVQSSYSHAALFNPILAIGPNVPDAAEFEFVANAGVFAPTAVPEPPWTGILCSSLILGISAFKWAEPDRKGACVAYATLRISANREEKTA